MNLVPSKNIQMKFTKFFAISILFVTSVASAQVHIDKLVGWVRSDSFALGLLRVLRQGNPDCQLSDLGFLNFFAVQPVTGLGSAADSAERRDGGPGL